MNIGVCGTGTVASWMSDTVVQMQDEDLVLYGCATSLGFDCTEFSVCQVPFTTSGTLGTLGLYLLGWRHFSQIESQ